MNNSVLLFVWCTLALAAATSLIAEDTTQKPNILFIMADDLGKEWISCYGADDIQTPRIDELAQSGMKFTHAYSMPKCTPSRVSLLTGTYPFRNGWVNHWDVPRWGEAYFDWKHEGNTTFARLMKSAGYKTFAAGKWQINDFRVAPMAMREHGFDEWAMWTGYESGVSESGQRYHNPYVNTPEGSRALTGSFGPDVFVDSILAFMQTNQTSPMCIYYPMVLPHTPLVPTPDEPSVSSKLDRHKAMVRYVDKMVGRLIDGLVHLGLRQNTIVIFTTDNGSTGRIIGSRHGQAIKGGKGTNSQAGVSAPFIVNCPGIVPAGVETSSLVDFTDLLPTFVALAGGTVPENLSLDGHSFAPLITGQAADSPRQWALTMGGGQAVLDELGIKPAKPFAARAIWSKDYVAQIDENRSLGTISALHENPQEDRNVITALFQSVLEQMPRDDARPVYEARATAE